MKRSLFAFSLLALLFTGFSAAQAQSVIVTPTQPVKAAVTPFEAYRTNFTNAVNEGNVAMADAHRHKLANHMERDIQAAESVSKTPQPTSPTPNAADIARQKEILATFKSMDLSTPEAVAAAKTKLGLIDEFGQLTAKRTPASN